MKRYELRVKAGTVDISHYLKKYICFYDIQDGYCTKIASSDKKDVIEKSLISKMNIGGLNI